MKLQIKYLLSIPIAGLSLFLFLTPVAADGIKGVTVGSGGSIVIDSSQAGAMSSVNTMSGFWNKIFGVFKYLIFGITGCLCIAMVGVFAVKAFQLSTSGANPRKKQEAIDGMLYAFIGSALMGGATMLSGLAFNLFR